MSLPDHVREEVQEILDRAADRLLLEGLANALEWALCWIDNYGVRPRPEPEGGEADDCLAWLAAVDLIGYPDDADLRDIRGFLRRDGVTDNRKVARPYPKRPQSAA